MVYGRYTVHNTVCSLYTRGEWQEDCLSQFIVVVVVSTITLLILPF